jgi:sigma-E factor negative regulatory protein RseC
MLEQPAIVLAIEGENARVEARESGTCGSCGTAGCSTRRLAQLFGRQRGVFSIANVLQARSGEQVVIGIPSGLLWRSAFRLYGSPLIAMVGGALAGQWLGGDLMAIMAAAGGLAIAFAWQRIAPAPDPGVPVMLRRLGDEAVVVVKSC